MGVQNDAEHLLMKLGAEGDGSDRGRLEFRGEDVSRVTGLSPEQINDAVDILEDRGYVKTRRWLGSHPYEFGTMNITSLGRLHLDEIGDAVRALTAGNQHTHPIAASQQLTLRPTPVPIGSPFGFTDEDWEKVRADHNDSAHLIVVFGHQWQSTFFETEKLRANIGRMFTDAVECVLRGRMRESSIAVDYRPLQGGYGGHLFNHISRDIIGSDIAVFDTSDLNPNVMIELGVALTWGVRTFSIHDRNSPLPPSDISGQTWAEYYDSGSQWSDPGHGRKVSALVEHAVAKKLARQR